MISRISSLQEKCFLVVAALWVQANSIAAAVAPATAKNGLVVLVPGILNSMVPGDPMLNSEPTLKGRYFSRVAVHALESRGFDVFIPVGLSPVGDVAENGDRVYEQLVRYYTQHYPQGDQPIFLIGHSAGGLFSLKVLDRNTSLPIKSVIALSTPFQGSPFSDFVFGDCQAQFDCNKIREKLTKIVDKLGFEGLEQMRSSRVREFLSSLVIPENVGIYSIGSTQYSRPGARSGATCLLCISSKLVFHGKSDGLVGHDSAYGNGLPLLDRAGHTVAIQQLREFHAPLGHHEMAVSDVLLRLLRQKNGRWVRKYLKRLYNRLGDFILGQVNTNQ